MQLQIEKSWFDMLKNELSSDYVQQIKTFLTSEEKSGRITYPRKEDIFKAFLFSPLKNTKVVILGQDPYHGPNQAHGLSFSVPEGVKPPPSLVNIFKELNTDLNLPIPTHGSLVKWAKQGVLLLNTILTVRAKEPKSHHGIGWEKLTTRVIEVLASKKEPLVFMLWGKSAQDKLSQVSIAEHHLVLTAAHPSPYSATGFFGCHHFSKANAFLREHGIKEIDWSL